MTQHGAHALAWHERIAVSWHCMVILDDFTSA
jgi:hypothetical protein